MNWNEIPTIKSLRPHPNAKFTVEQVREIRRLLASGVEQKVIAIDFNTSSSHITEIRYHRVYKGII